MVALAPLLRSFLLLTVLVALAFSSVVANDTGSKTKKGKAKKGRTTKSAKASGHKSKKIKSAKVLGPKICRKKTKSSKHTSATGAPISPTRSTDPVAAQMCRVALFASGFDILDVDRFDDWFTDESVLEVAEGGRFKGTKNIREFISFATGPFFQGYVEAAEPSSFPILLTDDLCIITYAIVRKISSSTPLTNGGAFETVVGAQMHYTVQPDGISISMHRFNLFYPEAMWQLLFVDTYGTMQMDHYVCNVLYNNCPETYEDNKLGTINQCMDMLNNLPLVENGRYVDGKSRGCRYLHVGFAMQNPDYCPYISFLPYYDKDCNLKCQKTAGKLPLQLFSQEELDFFQDYGNNASLGVDMVSVITPVRT